MDSGWRGGEGGTEELGDWEWSLGMAACKTDATGSQLLSRGLGLVLRGDTDVWVEVQQERDICVHMSDSLHCTAGSETTLESNYMLI